jgi:hypothetical protein
VANAAVIVDTTTLFGPVVAECAVDYRAVAAVVENPAAILAGCVLGENAVGYRAIAVVPVENRAAVIAPVASTPACIVGYILRESAVCNIEDDLLGVTLTKDATGTATTVAQEGTISHSDNPAAHVYCASMVCCCVFTESAIIEEQVGAHGHLRTAPKARVFMEDAMCDCELPM